MASISINPDHMTRSRDQILKFLSANNIKAKYTPIHLNERNWKLAVGPMIYMYNEKNSK